MAFFAAVIGFGTKNLFLDPSAKFWEGSFIPILIPEHYSYFDPLIILPVAGFMLAWVIYIKGFALNSTFKKYFRPIYQFCFNKWFIDELYSAIIVRPILLIGRMFWKIGDEKIIENMGPNFLSYIANYLGVKTKKLQTGYISDYVIIILGFLVFLIPAVFLWRYLNV
jgi:NADH:ubiquinone oxidoreductase subunit 5 (subunit L)/multisubunit Na+/H+ antiporter MnhA subunit